MQRGRKGVLPIWLGSWTGQLDEEKPVAVSSFVGMSSKRVRKRCKIYDA
jgi:hypothetical protein